MSSRDEDQLRILGLFHYALAAMEAMIGLFPLVDLVAGMGIVTERFGSEAEPSASYGWALVATSLLATALGLALAALTATAGRRLIERRAHSFCTFVAAINCLFFPFGTVLGVFTLIVLKRATVKQMFDATTHLENVAAWEDRTLP